MIFISVCLVVVIYFCFNSICIRGGVGNIRVSLRGLEYVGEELRLAGRSFWVVDFGLR